MMQHPDSVVVVRDAKFTYGERAVLDRFNLTLNAGEITALLGPSGCGKTTLLRAIAGMEVLEGGEISINAGRGQIPISYMFQDYDTFPWLTVRQNIRLSGESKNVRIVEAADRLGLKGLLGRYPRQLSGGQRKRVALARCLLASPALLLMDEPFGSLDVKTKIAIFELIERAYLNGERAGLFVTHSIEEAVILADRIIVLAGPPLTIVDDLAVSAARPRKSDFLESDVAKALEAQIMRRLLV